MHHQWDNWQVEVGGRRSWLWQQATFKTKHLRLAAHK